MTDTTNDNLATPASLQPTLIPFTITVEDWDRGVAESPIGATNTYRCVFAQAARRQFPNFNTASAGSNMVRVWNAGDFRDPFGRDEPSSVYWTHSGGYGDAGFPHLVNQIVEAFDNRVDHPLAAAEARASLPISGFVTENRRWTGEPW